MDSSTFLIFIVGFFVGMIFLRWISKNKQTSQDQGKERLHFEDQEDSKDQNSPSSTRNKKTRS
jgi:cbb3-type cytochrome oxidase subunit 3